jgi:hypothetical protein
MMIAMMSLFLATMTSQLRPLIPRSISLSLPRWDWDMPRNYRESGDHYILCAFLFSVISMCDHGWRREVFFWMRKTGKKTRKIK